jgi:hypothetical protein
LANRAVPSPETKRLTRLRLRPSDAQLWRLCSIRSRYVAQCWGNRTRMTGHSELEAIGARQRLLPNHPSSLSSRARRVLRVVWAGTPTRLHESDRRHLARLRHGPRARLNLGPTTVQQGVTAGNAVMERPRHQDERMAHVNALPCLQAAHKSALRLGRRLAGVIRGRLAASADPRTVATSALAIYLMLVYS